MNVTLAYSIGLGLQTPTAISAKLGAVPIPAPGEEDALGLSLVSDVTTVLGTTATRTLTFNTTPFGDELWPTAEALKDGTRNLFRAAISLHMAAEVSAAEPVVV